MRRRAAAICRGLALTLPAPPELIQAAAVGFAEPNNYPIDARGLAYHYAFIGIKRLGAGQFYMISIKDKAGESFDGAKTYRVTVPPNAPVEQYWSLTAYDRETHALIKKVARADNFTYPQTAVFFPPKCEGVAFRLAKQLGVAAKPLPGGAGPCQLYVIVGPARGPGE